MMTNRDRLRLLRSLLDAGDKLDADAKPLEAGWLKLRACMQAGVPQGAVDVAHYYFMCGALHLFEQITDNDVAAMDLDDFDERMCGLRDELEVFIRSTMLQHAPTRGSA